MNKYFVGFYNMKYDGPSPGTPNNCQKYIAGEILESPLSIPELTKLIVSQLEANDFVYVDGCIVRSEYVDYVYVKLESNQVVIPINAKAN